MKSLPWIAAALLVVCASPAAAQPAAPPAAAKAPGTAVPEFDDGTFTAFSFYAENDVIFQLGGNEDRNYTGGFGFQFSGSFVRKARLDAPLRLLDRTFVARKHDRWDRRFYTLLIFGTGFTPDMLNEDDVIADDRPYASLLGVSVRRLSVNDQTFDEAWSSEFAFAMLGLHQARNLQSWLHERLREKSGKPTPYEPLGWHHQISEGGEPTALYRIGYERRLAGAPSDPNSRKHFQFTGGWGASAGYYTNVTGVANARLGWFTSDFWEFTPGAMNVATQNLGTGRRRTPEWELFLFAGARPRLNIYNALLQGQFKDSDHTVPIRRLQAEWDFGVALFIPVLRTQITWNAVPGRTSELTVGKARTHTWGSLVGTYAWPVRK